uniref:Myb/SANT-like DNA-binding domain-containing protein n=1 Tax=Cynoglossus semilaevis TaxID=244447 RepID=A0A3P8VSQ8_CYNSE
MQANPTRGFLWSDVETRTLLNIWGEQDIQTALDGNFRNSFVYRDVSRRLGTMGFERTPEQCRVRIKSLKRQYLLAKEGNIRNNGQYHKICKFYENAAERPSTLGSCTCSRCLDRCSPASPPPLNPSLLPPLLRLVPAPARHLTPAPLYHAHVANPVTSDTLHP